MKNFIREKQRRKLASNETDSFLKDILRENEILFDLAADGIYILDDKANVIQANKSFLDSHGYTLADLDSLNVKDFETAMNYDQLLEELIKLEPGGRPLVFATTHKRKNGTTFNVEVSVNAVVLRNKHYYYASSRDTSDRKDINEILGRESELQFNILLSYENIFNISADGIHILEEDGTVIYANDSFLTMLGYTPGDLGTLNVSQFEAAVSPDKLKAGLINFIPSTREVKIFDSKHLTKSGQVIDVQVSLRAGTIKGRRVYFAASRDISERIQFEKNLKRINELNQDLIKELQDKEQKQKTLFAIIGHELRTPASALHMLLEQQNISKLEPFGPQISETIDHLLAVLDNMRIVTNPDEMLQSEIKSDCINHVLKSCVTMLGRELASANLKVHLDLPQSKRQECQVRTQLLRQIILNLIKNAAIHSGATDLVIRGVVKMTGNLIDYKIFFEDNGIGIPEKKHNRIFEPFEKIKPSISGMGLGLHISRSYAREYFDGDLHYEPREGGGSVFILSLNLQCTTQETHVQKNLKPEKKDLFKGLRVLLAEDTHTLMMATVLGLRERGAEVTQAINGKEAFEQAQAYPIDFILTDIFMPVMNGYELCRSLRKQGYDLPIIGLTAAVVGTESDELVAAGANAVLAKPINYEKLYELLKLLGKR